MVERLGGIETVAPDRTAAWPFALAVSAACWAATIYGAQQMSGSMAMPGGWNMSMA